MVTISETEVGALTRVINELKVSQIFAEADLKSVKSDGSFYSKYSHMLAPDVQQQIAMNLDEICSIAYLVPTIYAPVGAIPPPAFFISEPTIMSVPTSLGSLFSTNSP